MGTTKFQSGSMYFTFTQPKRQNGVAGWPSHPADIRITCGVDATVSLRLWEANG